MDINAYLNSSAEDRLAIFLSTLSVTNRTPEYYVNWEKVERETKQFELELHTLNYLIGKTNIYDEALRLFSKQPELLRAIPTLIASRDKILDILSINDQEEMSFDQLNFSKIDTLRIQDYVDFVKQAGLLDFLQSKAVLERGEKCVAGDFAVHDREKQFPAARQQRLVDLRSPDQEQLPAVGGFADLRDIAEHGHSGNIARAAHLLPSRPGEI